MFICLLPKQRDHGNDHESHYYGSHTSTDHEMERRSGRLRFFPPKSMAEDGSDAEMDEYVETSSPVAKKPANKKRKVAAPTNFPLVQAQFKRTKGKRGLLKDVVDMPMDVLYEVSHFFTLGNPLINQLDI